MNTVQCSPDRPAQAPSHSPCDSLPQHLGAEVTSVPNDLLEDTLGSAGKADWHSVVPTPMLQEDGALVIDAERPDTSAQALTLESLDGCWLTRNRNPQEVRNGKVMASKGHWATIKFGPSRGTFILEDRKGSSFTGLLGQSGELHWSDGDAWRRWADAVRGTGAPGDEALQVELCVGEDLGAMSTGEELVPAISEERVNPSSFLCCG